MAEVITAAHDADKATDMTAANPFGDDVTIRLRGAQLHIDGFLAYLNSRKQFGE